MQGCQGACFEHPWQAKAPPGTQSAQPWEHHGALTSLRRGLPKPTGPRLCLNSAQGSQPLPGPVWCWSPAQLCLPSSLLWASTRGLMSWHGLSPQTCPPVPGDDPSPAGWLFGHHEPGPSQPDPAAISGCRRQDRPCHPPWGPPVPGPAGAAAIATPQHRGRSTSTHADFL